jgi:hypothetical protein
MKQWHRSLALVLVGMAYGVLASSAWAASSLPTQALSVSLAVEGEADFVSVTARHVPLHTVLTEIATRAGFHLTELLPLTHPISVVCRRAPLDVALTQLLQEEGASFMFVYHPLTPQKLHQVVVLRAHPAGKGRFLRPSLVGGLQPQAAACVRLPTEKGQEPPELATPLEADGQPFEVDTSPEVDTSLDALLASTSSADVQAQTAALEALASQYATEARARQTVLAALGDPDPYVRSVIVGTLSSVLTQWPEAEELLMRALSDPEPEVRRRALSVLWEKAPPRSNEVLNIALHDTDPAIRRQADELLQEVALPGVVDQ